MRALVMALMVLGCAGSTRSPNPVSSGSATTTTSQHPQDAGPRPTVVSCPSREAGRVCFAPGLSGLGRAADEAHFEERPPHAARLLGFELDRTEVTVEQWQRCVDAGRCAAPSCPQPARDEPVRCVSWREATAYCEYRNGRLPTEAEWERAAAGALPEHRTFPWGERAEEFQSIGDRTPEGVVGLGSGVAEWTADPGGFYPAIPREPRDAGLDGGDATPEPDATSFSDEPEVATDTTDADALERLDSGLYVLNDPRGEARSVWRVVRGGDARMPVTRQTTTLRRFRRPDDRLPWVGLRCAYPTL